MLEPIRHLVCFPLPQNWREVMTTFTKNKQTGNYDIIGLVTEVAVGQCRVTKKDGTTKWVTISRVSRPFVGKFGPLKGQQCVIGTVQSQREQRQYEQRQYESGRPVLRKNSQVYYCGYPCPVTHLKCCEANGPCHDCM